MCFSIDWHGPCLTLVPLALLIFREVRELSLRSDLSFSGFWDGDNRGTWARLKDMPRIGGFSTKCGASVCSSVGN